MPDETNQAAASGSQDSATTKLAELKARRSSVKGQITKFANYLKALDKDESLTSIQINELSLKINKMKDIYPRFDELQSEIEVLNSRYQELELAERDIIENSLYSNIAAAQDKLDEASRSKADSDQSFMQPTCQHDRQDNSMGFQLPNIKISNFDGAYFRWMEFRETFESLIHNNQNQFISSTI